MKVDIELLFFFAILSFFVSSFTGSRSLNSKHCLDVLCNAAYQRKSQLRESVDSELVLLNKL